MKELESTFFYAIILSFTIALLVNGPSYTGLVTGQAETEIIEISEVYSGFEILKFELKGNLTSVKITGEFIGNGTGIVKSNNLILVESKDFEKKSVNLITGMVIGETSNESVEENISDNIEIFENTTEEIVEESNETIKENQTLVEINDSVVLENITEELQINESVIENETSNITETNITDVNETTEINETIEINETTSNQTNISENSDEINEDNEDDVDIQPEIIENETIEVNETVNVSIENITDTNTTLNITDEVNITINQTQENITEDVSEELTGKRISFENYCKETCLIEQGNNLTIIIALEDLKINITKITYTYIPGLENISENLTTNYSLNISINQTNLTLLNLTNATLNITENITTLEINYTDIEIFNKSLLKLKLLDYTENSVKLGFGKNIIKLLSNNLSLLKTELIETDDSRLTSDIFLVKNIVSANITLETDSAEVILKCLQFTNNTCKKWQETNISYVFFNKTTSFEIKEKGIYSVGKIIPKNTAIIPTNSVYYNSDCEHCVEKFNCNAKVFCVMENAVEIKTTYIGQLDFDIFGLNNSWYKAEVCAYKSYSTADVVNYIKYSPESFCSDINNGNSTSDIISYKIIEDKTNLVCIDASELLRYSQEKKHSNLFVNWIGENLNGARFPFNCYYGVSNKTNCQTNNTDCKPYLKLYYQ